MKRIKLTPEWSEKIEGLAPSNPQAAPQTERLVLIFTLMTGFEHWVTPHTAEVIRILGEKTGAYESVVSDDLSHFEAENIGRFDAIILVNNCSKRPERNLFYDALGDMEKANELEENLIRFVEEGNGLVPVHGAIVMQNNSEPFCEMIGGAFAFHPKQTIVTGKVVDSSHPITSAFEAGEFHHKDEPYLFKGAYYDFDFRPLLEMELPDVDQEVRDQVFLRNGEPIKRYISWIRSHGEGRVFYCGPAHNAQSFEDPELLQFILNGIQYALGDLECDDSPLAQQE
ncbi:MAG: ThuA domain-containing protein [Verrucomicrobiota bacterium]